MGSVVFWLLEDVFLVGIVLLILGARYVSSMIGATKEIMKEIRRGRCLTKLGTENNGQNK